MIDPIELKGKTVLFNYRDRNGETHHQSYGKVVRPGRKAVGSGITAAGRVVKRRTVPAVVIKKGFTSIGLGHEFNKFLIVALEDVLKIRVRGRDIPITEYQGGATDGRAEDTQGAKATT